MTVFLAGSVRVGALINGHMEPLYTVISGKQTNRTTARQPEKGLAVDTASPFWFIPNVFV